MPRIKVEVLRLSDESVPGWVECRLIDAFGRVHSFSEKAPVVSDAPLDAGTAYPVGGAIRCTILTRRDEPTGREVFTVDTAMPDGVESTEGVSRFDVVGDTLVDDDATQPETSRVLLPRDKGDLQVAEARALHRPLLGSDAVQPGVAPDVRPRSRRSLSQPPNANTFEDWPLHDATLYEVRIDWRARVCRLLVAAFVEPGRDAERHVLVFMGVTSVRVPRHDPWGSSSFINRTARGPDGEYLIEVQSGDVIEIRASQAEFAAAEEWL